MNLGDDDLRLLCIIEGEAEAFPIDIGESSWRNPKFIVGDLKKKIQEERKNDSLAGVGAHILILWKVRCYRRIVMLVGIAYSPSFQPEDRNPIDVKPKQTLPERVASVREPEEELDPTDSVLTIFPEQPSLDHLHIVVRIPDTGE